MQTHLICYSDDQMTISQQLCTRSAREVGKIDHTYALGPHAIDPGFTRLHKDILTADQRGGGKGFWLWKPYIVQQAIENMNDGDILIYCDSGIEWVNDVNHLLRAMAIEKYEAENDIFLFSNGHRHIDWCKKEVFDHMLPNIITDYPRRNWEELKQVQASVMLFRVNSYTKEFCKHWLAWSCIPGFIDDTLRGPQFGEFREHRNDQSILTNLQIADDIPLHFWPAQYWENKRADFPGDRYPQMFYHHRRRNPEWLEDYKRYGADAISVFMKQNKRI
jgi:hypothetical protein